jgi:alpha-tubulin suppressor-like RCC1 family protein
MNVTILTICAEIETAVSSRVCYDFRVLVTRFALGGVLVVIAACSHTAYECTSSDQCVSGGVQGSCQPESFCAFPDTTCPSGERFEANAGSGLGGACVSDVPACGTVGGACCTDGPACGPNTVCSNGTCSQCVTASALGLFHSCFEKSDGTVWCAGLDTYGQLGNGGTSTLPTTTAVQARDATGPIRDVTAIGAGHFHTCAVRAGGAVWCWGHNNDGNGNRGELGNGTTNDSSVATQVLRESDNQPLTGIVEVSASYCHTCARDTAGGVWCWGCNGDSQLGDGTTTEHLSAVPVLAAAGGAPFTGALELGVGDGHNCVRRAGGEIWCWGRNHRGQIGNNTLATQAVPVKILDGATSLAVGRYHTCVVTSTGAVNCWGSGNQGRLGNGTGDKDPGTALDKLVPIPAITAINGPPFDGAASVAAGAVSCAVKTTGDPYCWGINLYGQTGTGVGSYVPAPVLRNDGTPLQRVDHITAHFTRACAFGRFGDVACWGRNSEGQLGDGVVMNRGFAEPVKLSCP